MGVPSLPIPSRCEEHNDIIIDLSISICFPLASLFLTLTTLPLSFSFPFFLVISPCRALILWLGASRDSWIHLTSLGTRKPFSKLPRVPGGHQCCIKSLSASSCSISRLDSWVKAPLFGCTHYSHIKQSNDASGGGCTFAFTGGHVPSR
ncbi:hypothetical protein DUNSADRAFT_2479 [Dunaliella salina]|uniref:Encoded protein n=1 Tax=Dunaliella salina TaxID=3046 RepID=A0ABQ7GVK4_DUNSA|nr:hypothetical protein DUNSADRAFT_2479 [Dunaliella salina]|eukprot:KAF5838644.1 hypothetical protein DUNSADRAFT_2479 [Dunaliella salina]